MMIARSVWLYKAQKSSSSCHDGGEDFDGIQEEGGGTGDGGDGDDDGKIFLVVKPFMRNDILPNTLL